MEYFVLVPKTKSPRAVIVKFLSSVDKEQALRRGKDIYFDTGIRLEDDYPMEIEQNRIELKPFLHTAQRIRTANGYHKYKASLNMDKLNINGRLYTVNNLNKLPHELKPENMSTPSKKGITAFFTKNSPLSNHHLASQEVRGVKYSSNEQFYMHQKAVTFADNATASQIMKENTPNPLRPAPGSSGRL